MLHCHTQWYLHIFFPFPYSLVMYLFSATENSTALCSREWQAQCCDTPLGAGSPSRWQGGSHVAILVFIFFTQSFSHNYCGNLLLLLSIQETSIHSLVPRPHPAFHCVRGEPGNEATLSMYPFMFKQMHTPTKICMTLSLKHRGSGVMIGASLY